MRRNRNQDAGDRPNDEDLSLHLARQNASRGSRFSAPRTRTCPWGPRAPGTAAGFTLVELMIVMAIIGVLAVVAIPSYVGAVRQAREAVLKEDLHVMRAAIDSYTADKQKAPQSLDDLVNEGYLRSIPVDPMTRAADTWQTSTSDALHSLDQTDPGIDDVHSGSQEQGSDGQPYSAW